MRFAADARAEGYCEAQGVVLVQMTRNNGTCGWASEPRWCTHDLEPCWAVFARSQVRPVRICSVPLPVVATRSSVDVGGKGVVR
jgi:hypothetical protein